MTLPREVCVLGLGLMGGSIGLALRERHPEIRTSGWSRRPGTRAQAVDSRVVQRVAETPAEAVRGADLVILCGPVRSLPEMARECRDALAPGALVTDVGSTKEWLMREVPEALAGSGAVFVGSHPMCGSEQQGLSSACANLYEDAFVAVTAHPGPAEQAAAGRIEGFWRALGARPVRMAAPAHDTRVAAISHLPHVAAALIVEAALRGEDPGRDAMIAGGFRDTTRVASGPADVWIDILRTNRGPVDDMLSAMESGLVEVRRMLAAEDWNSLETWLDECRKARGRILP